MCAETNNTKGVSRILVGEDDKFLSNIYKTKLTKIGFQVDHALNGEEALKMAREGEFKNLEPLF
ncbi:MAG: hypothetical protein COS71_00780 [Candidatus Moranbacteria bacterium CG06_land_8_20_14_3_00_40_12]|nr:MAG: hypothetical protein COS71_00780 [Candidatus Moranbacteria bacterium CG06_land_8_20_14_3_00_40_12]